MRLLTTYRSHFVYIYVSFFAKHPEFCSTTHMMHSVVVWINHNILCVSKRLGNKIRTTVINSLGSWPVLFEFGSFFFFFKFLSNVG